MRFGGEPAPDRHVGEGRHPAPVGPSGSGKSTLLRTINALERPDQGYVRIDGDVVGFREQGGRLHELSERDIARQRSKVGMVFQRFNFFPHMTALENIIEAPVWVQGERREAAKQRASALLARVGPADTMLVVTHVLGFAREASDSVIFMDDGKIVSVPMAIRWESSGRLRRAFELCRFVSRTGTLCDARRNLPEHCTTRVHGRDR